MKLAKFTSGVNTSFSTELNGNTEASLTTAHQNRIDTLRSITERTPSDVQTEMQRDIFTDADGKNDTVNTGNTTANFDTSYYIPDISKSGANASTTGSGASLGTPITINFTTSAQGYIDEVPICTPDLGNVTVQVYGAGAELLATKVQDPAVDNQVETVNFVMSDYTRLLGSSETGYITVSHGVRVRYNASISVSPTGITVTSQPMCADIGATTSNFGYTSVTITAGVVETDALTSTGDNITSIFMSAQTEVDTTDLTYDVSVDNGSTWTTGLSYNTINQITSTAGNQLIIKHNIPGEVDAKLYGYSYVVGR